jgi:hypothetical protein
MYEIMQNEGEGEHFLCQTCVTNNEGSAAICKSAPFSNYTLPYPSPIHSRVPFSSTGIATVAERSPT